MIFNNIPEDGMHIDDVVELMMQSQSEVQIAGLKDMSKFPLQVGKPEVHEKLLSIANKIEIETEKDSLRELYKQFMTVFTDFACNISEERENEEATRH